MENILELSKKYLDLDISDLTKKDIKILQDIILFHNDLYYNKDNPIISDYEYDKLYKKLKLLEENFSIKEKKSSNIGADVLKSSFKKVKHSRPMISLDNTYNEEDLRDFDERVKKNIIQSSSFISKKEAKENIEYTLEFKFDGLGIELIYKDGNLVQAITRGNGLEGEDVTVNIMQIDNIPKTIDYKEHLEVRGEVVMPISSFEYLNNKAKKEGTKVFSNPRNAASGSVRMKDAKITKTRKLKFFAYDLSNFKEFRSLASAPLFEEATSIKKYYEVIKALEKLGFEISSYFKKQNGIEEVIESINNFGDLKSSLDFEIDGLVLKVNDISLWQIIGWTEHHPKYAIAYKFPAEIVTTKILGVEHSVGRTGTITPVANLEPINIGGAIIKRATLHNYEEVENLDVRIGDTVFIKRAGEVIPKIISVVKTEDRSNLEKISPPEFCPSCKQRLKKDEDKVRFYCPNSYDCPAQHIEKLIFAVSKQGFNIDGLGSRQIELFLELGIISNLISIFKLEDKKQDILGLEGFQEKSVNNLIDSINKAKNTGIVTLITSLGIPGVGKKTAKTLGILFKSRQDLVDFNYTEEDLIDLEDIGPEIAKNIVKYFTDENHKKILSELLDLLNIEYYKKMDFGNSKLSQKKVCITGSFDGYSRDELIEKLEKVGGSFVSSVSTKTDYLLAGEKAGSKLKKANELGIEVIDLKKILDFLDN